MVNDLIKCASIKKTKNPPFLFYAWQELYKKAAPVQRQLTCGVDRVTINDFKKNYHENLKIISKSIKSSDGYIFSNLKPVFRPKDNGKERLICIPTVADRIVQKSIQSVLLKNNKSKYLKFNKVNFGFVKKKSVNDAIKKAIKERNKKKFVFRTDISSFFDEIDRDLLKLKVKQYIKNSSLHELIFKIIDCEIDDDDKRIKEKVKRLGIKKGKGVRQGMPISPLFANLFLYDLDMTLIKKKISAVRYADDLLFFANNEAECKEIFKICKEELGKINLSIPEICTDSKSQIFKPHESVEFLGLCISQNSNQEYYSELSEKQRNKIRDNFLNYSDIDYLVSRNITLKNYSMKLRGLIAGYSGVYEHSKDFQELNTQMYSWTKKALRRLMREEYGIDYDALNEKQKRFLEILK